MTRPPPSSSDRVAQKNQSGSVGVQLALRWLVTPPEKTTLTSSGPLDDAAWEIGYAQKPQQLLARGANVTRRGLGLVTLLVLSALGAGLLLVFMVLLGIGLAQGHVWAGIFLFLVVLLALFAGWWVYQRATELLGMRSAAQLAPRAAPTSVNPAMPDDETALLGLLRQYERAVPAAVQPALQATVLATRDALRAASREGLLSLSRDLYDARQAVREDLPELLDAYAAVPSSAQSDVQLLEHLRTIEQRMQAIIAAQRQVQNREMSAQGVYLRDKYQPEGIEPVPVESLAEPKKVPASQRKH